jgi:CDP-glycerol glycerophosphotransferase (TagB/SpsB family)
MPETQGAKQLSQIVYLPRLAFALQTSEVYHHFHAIMDCLNPQDYDIILINPDPDLRALAETLPCRCRDLNTLLQAPIEGYRYLVTHHYHGMMKIHLSDDPTETVLYPLIKYIAQYNIRLMYGLGHDDWNLAEWNQYYDLHLCFGPWQVAQLAFSESIKLEVGVPRYSAYFKHTQNSDYISQLRQKWQIQPAEKVVIYFPTLGAHNTLPTYAEHLNNLAPPFKLLIKPHPLSWQEEPLKLACLDLFSTESIIRQDTDNLELLLLADFVICDYGGVAFSAIYTDKPLILLDLPATPLLQNESDALLRKAIPPIELQKGQSLQSHLNDSTYWQAQTSVRKRLQQQFFAAYKANSAPWTAKILTNLEDYFS